MDHEPKKTSLFIYENKEPLVVWSTQRGVFVPTPDRVSLIYLEDSNLGRAVQLNYLGPYKLLSLQTVEKLTKRDLVDFLQDFNRLNYQQQPFEVIEDVGPLVLLKLDKDGKPIYDEFVSCISFGRKINGENQETQKILRGKLFGNILLRDYNTLPSSEEGVFSHEQAFRELKEWVNRRYAIDMERRRRRR